MFGEGLWNNAVLIGTKWGYHPVVETRRRQDNFTGFSSPEEKRRDDLNTQLSRFGLTKDLEMVFIDSYYDVSSDDKEIQHEKFKENTDKLWKLAKQMNPFDCKHVEAARLKIKNLQGSIHK